MNLVIVLAAKGISVLNLGVSVLKRELSLLKGRMFLANPKIIIFFAYPADQNMCVMPSHETVNSALFGFELAPHSKSRLSNN